MLAPLHNLPHSGGSILHPVPSLLQVPVLSPDIVNPVSHENVTTSPSAITFPLARAVGVSHSEIDEIVSLKQFFKAHDLILKTLIEVRK